MKFGPFPMYEFAPIITDPHEIAPGSFVAGSLLASSSLR
jgi:hypothetical protein